MRHQEILAIAKANVNIITLELKQAKSAREINIIQHKLDFHQDYVTQNEGR